MSSNDEELLRDPHCMPVERHQLGHGEAEQGAFVHVSPSESPLTFLVQSTPMTLAGKQTIRHPCSVVPALRVHPTTRRTGTQVIWGERVPDQTELLSNSNTTRFHSHFEQAGGNGAQAIVNTVCSFPMGRDMNSSTTRRPGRGYGAP